MNRKEISLFLIPLFYLAVILMVAIPELIGESQPSNPGFQESSEIFQNLPENCKEVLKTRLGGVKPYYSVVCYEGNGLFLEPIIRDRDDSAFIARLEAVKDSLRMKFEGY